MPAGNMHVTLAVHVPVAAAILFAPCAGTADSLQTAAWVDRVLSPTDAWSPKVRDAATWASKLSPLADLSVVDLRCAFIGCGMALVFLVVWQMCLSDALALTPPAVYMKTMKRRHPLARFSCSFIVDI